MKVSMGIVPKVAACVLLAGATSCGLLVIRQQRIEAAYEMSVMHRHLLRHEERSWRLRVAIHERLRQDRVAALAGALERETGERLVPLLLDECYLVELPASAALTDHALAAGASPIAEPVR